MCIKEKYPINRIINIFLILVHFREIQNQYLFWALLPFIWLFKYCYLNYSQPVICLIKQVLTEHLPCAWSWWDCGEEKGTSCPFGVYGLMGQKGIYPMIMKINLKLRKKKARWYKAIEEEILSYLEYHRRLS